MATNHILIGLGGTGGKILKAFKMRMFEEFPNTRSRNNLPVSLLYVDSTREMMGIGRSDFRVMGLDASFQENEFLNIKGVNVEHILNNINNYPTVKGIVDNAMAVKTAIGPLGEAAGQMRRAGRLLFAANAAAFVNAIQTAYSRCVEQSHNANETTFHIFTGLCGGTGSGSIIDAIVQTRKTFPNAIISVYAMIPEENLPKPGMDQGRYYPNGYAALSELNGLQSGRFLPHDITGAGRKAQLFSDRVQGVANGLTLYSNVNENGLVIDSLVELPKIVSDYVYARIFHITSADEANRDILRAYSFENINQFALEYDETQNANADGRIPFARTKKINAFGIKRVMYPELRILKHITYSVGESVLYQFKYNNWRENFGYVNEETNRDYNAEYFNDANLAKWMLDLQYLTYESKILPNDKKYPQFSDYWHDKCIECYKLAKEADNPLSELEKILSQCYADQFRSVGVKEYYKGKGTAIPEIAKEVRRTIEHELFVKWKNGEISIVELQKISRRLIDYVTSIKETLNEKLLKEQEQCEEIKKERDENEVEWKDKWFLTKKWFRGDINALVEHQRILTDLFTCKTMIVALQFAQELIVRLFMEIGNLDADISKFGQKINDAIDETERLVAAQKKVNKGLEDMKGAIIEVSEEEIMSEFEKELKIDRVEMPNIARLLRDAILPKSDFMTFGKLENDISIDGICKAFDLELSKIVKRKHSERAESDRKVLGLNILSQLQQKLTTDEQIKKFARDIVHQSGVFLKLNNDQMQLYVRNNEGNLSPANPASINRKTILVSIPSPDDNENLMRFAEKLEIAFRDSFPQGNAQCTLAVNRKSPRKDELTIITVTYCFPMRCISWLEPYKEKYEQFLNTGNPNTDTVNAILVHGEGYGKDLPSLFVVENAEQSSSHIVPPPIPNIQEEPKVQIYFHIAGQNCGPYDYSTCKQMKQNGQISGQTLAWQQGMASWTPAEQVAELKNLFVSLPPMPPIPPAL